MMESLPTELCLRIFSFLDLNDLVSCRLICHSWKQLIDVSLRSVTHLQVKNKHTTEDWLERFRTYVHDRFLSQPLTQATIGPEFKLKHHPLFDFLEHFCPNLQVLYAPEFRIDYVSLFQISNALIYLRCEWIIMETSYLLLASMASNLSEDYGALLSFPFNDWLRLSERLFIPFEQLQCFDVMLDYPLQSKCGWPSLLRQVPFQAKQAPFNDFNQTRWRIT